MRAGLSACAALGLLIATGDACVAESLLGYLLPGSDPQRYGATSPDADALARLAPPSRRSTALQTYGDAAYARAHMRGRNYRGYGYGQGRGYGYAYQPSDDGYRPFYTNTPAYVSAPQIYRRVPEQQTTLLPLGVD